MTVALEGMERPGHATRSSVTCRIVEGGTAMIGRWNALDSRLRFGLLGLLGLLVIAGAPVAWYLGSPLFIDATVDEDRTYAVDGFLPTSCGSYHV